MRGKYTYGGSAEGALLTRIVRECAIIAAKYRLRACDFDDVVHDALMACQKKQNFDESRGVQLWTYMQWIVKSAANDACGRMVRTASRETQHPDGSTREVAADPDDAGVAPTPEQRRRLAQLQDAIEVLPARQRQVIVLRYGMAGHGTHTISQAAEAMGVSTRTVERHAATAMQTMRAVIEDMAAEKVSK